MSNIELKKQDKIIEIFKDGISIEKLERFAGIISLDLKTLTLTASEGSETFTGKVDLALGYLNVETNEFRKAEETESIVEIQYSEDDFRGWMEKVFEGDGWCNLDVGTTARGYRVGDVSIFLKKPVYKNLRKLYFNKHLDYLTIDLDFTDWLDITKDELGIYRHPSGLIVEHSMEGSQRGEVKISYGIKPYKLNMAPESWVHTWESNPVKESSDPFEQTGIWSDVGRGKTDNYYRIIVPVIALFGVLAFLFFILNR